MNPLRQHLRWLLCVACLALSSMLPSMATAQPAAVPNNEHFADQKPIDVELQPDGRLQGQVLAEDGTPLPCDQISLHNAGGQLATTTLDNDGHFCFAGVTGGTYQIIVGDDCRLVRAWTPGTAPPAARPQAVFDLRAAAVRGQYQAPPFLNSMARGIKYGATKPLVVGSVLAVAVGVPVIVHNAEQDNKS